MSDITKNAAYQYAEQALNENEGKVPKYVKLQCESWLNIADGLNPEAEVSISTMTRIERILQLMIHPDLRCTIYEGLEPYAWLLIIATLCTKLKRTQERYYITALLEIARKNFKTFNSAVIFILLMLTEPRFSRFFSVAPDLSLSSELKLAIKKIIKSSPALYDEMDPAFKILRSNIICNINENEYTPLAYSEDRMDGRLANAYLADEAGAMDSYPVEAMRSSQITLHDKLGIIISTQYPNDLNVMQDEIDYGKRVLDGLIPNKRYFSLLYEPDQEISQGDAWMKDDRILYQANPVAVTNEHIFEGLKDRRLSAILYENKRENFLCKHCNILYKGLGVEGYVDVQKVKLCKRAPSDDWWRGRDVWIGLDLSLSEDNTAVAMVTEENGVIYCKAVGFIPKGRVEIKAAKEKVDYDKLIKEKCCIACGEETVDYPTIEEHILKLEKRMGVRIMQIGYDRWNATSTVQQLEAAGYTCVEIKQHSSTLHSPTKFLKEAILNKKFAYDENRLLEINFQNARCTEDTNLNKYVNKKKSKGKVDMVVALINAIYLLQQELLYGNFTVQVG
ncbi:MAG: terminase [Butyrivibrio sp.]|uniref:terminase large subunit n=1 Tax=Butyrivibrio sp. TaxID=28121 RepID=UPI001B3D251B|nr:terminase TerL endonuclease subunit [Butyrivibrio sp.]MBP3784591.1 terminase [Butyrivibrio sp.]